MQSMNIADLLNASEGKTLEFKRDLSSPNGVLRTIIAFANTAGSTIIIGVEDKSKHIMGITNPLHLEEKLVNWVSDLISPQIFLEVEIISWKDTYLLSIKILPSIVKPHYFKQLGLEKGTYIRVGSSNRLADPAMISELQRVRILDSFDKEPMPELNIEAIDFKAAEEFFYPVKQLQLSDLDSMEIVTAYQNKKVPTVGGIILFGYARLKYFPDAWVQAGRFNGLTRTNIFDTREILAYPIHAVGEVIEFVKKHAMHSIQISETRHSETWSLPLTSIREAIINAVVHADYSQIGSPIRLSIFDDRIEIENPGLLLSSLTIDEIKDGVSKLRNRVIGQVFYRLGLIERWGSGIRRIIDTCLESGLPEPLFEEVATHFRVTIYTKKISKPLLNPLDQDIISILKKSNGLSTQEIARAIQKSPRSTRNHLIQLIEKGIVFEVAKSNNDPNKKYFYKK